MDDLNASHSNQMKLAEERRSSQYRKHASHKMEPNSDTIRQFDRKICVGVYKNLFAP